MHSLYPRFLWAHFFFFIIFNFPPLSSVPFLPSQNVTLFGDAYFGNNAISLTQDLSCHHSSSPSSSSGVGRAFYVNPVRFLDSETNSTASFSCRFTFSIVSSPSCHSGDGIAFMIISDTDLVSFSRGYMGLPSLSANQQDSYFAVEFDTNFDPPLGDINGNHIGIDVDTIISIASVDAISEGIDLKSGRKITAWIEYRDAQKIVRVWVGHSPDRPPTPILIAQIDLSEKLKEFMHVGFSASNVMGSGIHIIDRWQFKTFGFISSMNSMDMVEEGDCFFCHPETSTIATQQIDSAHYGREKLEEMALRLGGIAAFIVSALLICIFLSKRRKGSDGNPLREDQHCEFQTTNLPSRLSLSEINSATMGFSRDRLVGEGTSAKVYKGSLPYGGDVAVKRFGKVNNGSESMDYVHNPFTTEFATMAGCLRHKNLVQLQGWCCEGSELVLVYEYLPNGSLNRILHKNYNSSLVLSWKQRVNIILGVASALTYLHEECERQIIHRDVKTCNIMLDADFNAKLGDFGLAEVYEHSCDTREATLPAGTMGYLAPEYVYSGVPTVKTDVYSFGVVVLEVATGRKPVDDDGTVVVDYVWKMWERRKLVEAGDPRLIGKFDVREMERMLMVGLLCVHPDHENRPRVRDAARILKGEAPVPLLPASKPRVRLRPVLPNDTEETLDVIGNRPSTDEAPYLTPRSHFN
ncbi:L-type lectin-domain containing receptor kinase S.6 [Prosopis cineraria]|uniref:L-type lectin-domain containing receptor kinase S.6 n=1 Tax=Prosopis cineraria TaxID=364024 RepID=UPI0024101378|nr:L-type lectin-domain containing receptor kinase S.6 [Prosopis cineraria]